MASTSDGPRIAAENLRQFCVRCFTKLGLSGADAEITAGNLIFANLRGVDSHGVVRLKIYADRLRRGGFNARATPRSIAEGPSFALVDAGQGVGQVAAMYAMQCAIDKATQTGVAVAGVRNSNHFGAAAFYALKAVEHGMIGFAATNAGPSMAPTGGREARLGNNPFAIALPGGKYPPVVLDMATGAVAWGKIFLAQQTGQKIPTSWALDKNGVPTDDPDAAAHQGLIQPMAGYKGYGLSLVIDLLTGVLMGGGFSRGVLTLYQQLDQPAQVAHTCAALNLEAFMPAAEFHARTEEIIRSMHTCARSPGAERIYVPGEIEHEIAERRTIEGIPLSPPLLAELRTLATELAVAPPETNLG